VAAEKLASAYYQPVNELEIMCRLWRHYRGDDYAPDSGLVLTTDQNAWTASIDGTGRVAVLCSVGQFARQKNNLIGFSVKFDLIS